ncbi:nucleotide sugar dehydrogenase [Pseudomonas sp. B329]|uniref:nucleotide sugar dehydrogenase n=1 Tax=Pseudomonas sp. B329 TaxID=1553459 RepID=UPI00200643B6|nr:nucleotide sugar dehydrogenase [Pseudomonas sp. B329]MCK3860985.1 nucleotide sugar dehydrogenase [Pseudomonas sp. B329]
MNNTFGTVAVVGLGYVGLPLAVEFGKHLPTIGFDISTTAIEQYRDAIDPSGELTSQQLQAATHLSYTHLPESLRQADIIIVAVPTPVDVAHQPDLSPLLKATECVGRHMRRGALVIFESTVYPGATEEQCIPVLEQHSGLIWKRDFNVGYSPERINPGDRTHTLTRVIKVVSGDCSDSLDCVACLYELIVEPGVHRAPSIKVAEAAKVIENTQRDLNIALMNELSIIFSGLAIDTSQVLAAANTKWNFLDFKPGLVGGHCIGVDPYYLTYKAEASGYHPQIILAGRRINDGMGKWIAEKIIKMLIASGRTIKGATVNMLGVTFKENCSDVRNSKVIDIVQELVSYGVTVHIHDPVADPNKVQREYGLSLTCWEQLPQADALVVAVPHEEFKTQYLNQMSLKLLPRGCVVDVKSVLDRQQFIDSGYSFWRL